MQAATQLHSTHLEGDTHANLQLHCVVFFSSLSPFLIMMYLYDDQFRDFPFTSL